MDMRSRRKFVNEMMAATAMAMGGGVMFGQQSGIHTIPEGGPPYLPMGGVQVGPDGANGNPAPGAVGGGAPGGARAGAGGRGGGAPRAPRPKPAGISWISGTGTEKVVPSWDIKEHTKVTMDNIKRNIERQGGTMESFLYMQVFFCLRNDDSSPKPTGSAAAAKYLEYYNAIGEVYYSTDYWPNGRAGAPPRSCFALDWIPGNSLIEISAAYYIDPSVVPPPAPPRAPRGGGAPPA